MLRQKLLEHNTTKQEFTCERLVGGAKAVYELFGRTLLCMYLSVYAQASPLARTSNTEEVVLEELGSGGW